MKKTCFVVSLILHLLFVYRFTTLEFTHISPGERREKKEIIVVTPVKLTMPRLDHRPAEKELLVIDPVQEPVPAAREDRGEGLAGENKETEQGGMIGEKTGQGTGINIDPGTIKSPASLRESTSFPENSGTMPFVENRFSLSPGKIRNIIGNNSKKRSGTGTTAGRFSPVVRGCNIMPWARRTISKIKRNWSIPLASQAGIKGVAGVSVIVERDGKISSVRLEKSSASDTLDEAAIAAFTLSNPLPGLPDDYPYHDLRAYFLFNYNDRKIEQPANEKEEK